MLKYLMVPRLYLLINNKIKKNGEEKVDFIIVEKATELTEFLVVGRAIKTKI